MICHVCNNVVSHLLRSYFPWKRMVLSARTLLNYSLRYCILKTKSRDLPSRSYHWIIHFKKIKGKKEKKSALFVGEKCGYRGMICFNCRFVGPFLSSAPLDRSLSPLRQNQMAIISEQPLQIGSARHLVFPIYRKSGEPRTTPSHYQRS